MVVSFATAEPSTAQLAVERLLAHRGWAPPPWFRRLKEELEPVITDPQALTSMGLAAGLRSPVVGSLVVDSGISAPCEVVDWRLASPGVASFLAAMTTAERARLHAEAVDAVEALDLPPQPLMLELRVLSSRAPATRRSVSA